jgi:hypothetical protein
MKLGTKISKVLSVDPEEMSIKLRYRDDFTGTVSLKHIFTKPKGLASEILKGGMLDKCFVESGALAWPNGFELCPDAIRLMIKEQSKKKAA